MKILIIANTYPSLKQPNFGAFVYNLVQEFSYDNEVTILAPYNIKNIFKKSFKTYGSERCRVIRPYYLSFGDRKVSFINFSKLSKYSLFNAFKRGLRKIEKPDVVYVHFINNAFPLIDYVTKNRLPLFIASGESTYPVYKDFKFLDKVVSSYIAVSNKNMEALINLGVEQSRISLIPNAVDYNIFKPLDRYVCKENLGIPKEKFVVGFIGHFIHRKGPNRIIQALKQLNNPNLHLVCVGDGETLEENNFTTILPPMPNFQLNEIFNSFDIFVLPTLHEGHCNVIEEAKAACVPIISSKETSVESQLNKSIGILVDPLSISEISEAILKLYNDNTLLNSLKDNLIQLRGSNSIQSRAEKILKNLNITYKNG